MPLGFSFFFTPGLSLQTNLEVAWTMEDNDKNKRIMVIHFSLILLVVMVTSVF